MLGLMRTKVHKREMRNLRDDFYALRDDFYAMGRRVRTLEDANIPFYYADATHLPAGWMSPRDAVTKLMKYLGVTLIQSPSSILVAKIKKKGGKKQE